MIFPDAPAARAVAIAWATIRPAPLPEPVLPARSRIPATTGALVSVDRAQQRVDVDERLLLDPGQHLAALGQGDQVLAQHRFQLAGVPEAELAQQHPQGRGRVDPVEQDRHAACA
jgi:hypothetical protein